MESLITHQGQINCSVSHENYLPFLPMGRGCLPSLWPLLVCLQHRHTEPGVCARTCVHMTVCTGVGAHPSDRTLCPVLPVPTLGTLVLIAYGAQHPVCGNQVPRRGGLSLESHTALFKLCPVAGVGGSTVNKQVRTHLPGANIFGVGGAYKQSQ